ncbi:hypothetical protein [Paenibacillus dendrobii]|nr:hypothetical protein [Paenibacillus dendrobii]
MNLLHDIAVKLDLPKQTFEAFLAQDFSRFDRKTVIVRTPEQIYSVIYP